MKMLHTKSTKKNEKGIALIFTLIMLSLLLILALSFTMDSMFEQKAAYNSASASSSGFMAQAQLKQILLLMKEDQANFDSDDRLYSRDFYGTTDTDMLLERLPVADVLKYDPDNPTDSSKNDKVFDLDGNGTYDDPKVNWSYTKVDGKIISRTAFVVIPNDNIPLDSLLSKTHDEASASEARIGKDVSEINVRDAIPAVFEITNHVPVEGSAILSALNWSTAGKYKGIWPSFETLFTTLDSALSFNLNDTDKTEFKNKLSLAVIKDKEAFWAEASNGDRKIVDTELYQRFNLARGDWSTPATSAEDVTFIKNKILLTTSGAKPDQDMTSWSDSANLDGLGIPWLACFGYKDNGSGVGVEDEGLKATFGSVKNRRYQIAANLKDYCDSDDRPASDVNPVTSDTGTTWLNTSTAPTYTGNECTPYIDKLGVQIEAVQVGVANGSVYDISATVDVAVGVGLVNMYKTAWTAEALKLKVEGSIKVLTSITDGTVNNPTTIPFSYTLDFADTEWSGNYSRFVIGAAVPSSGVGKETGFNNANKKIDFVVSNITFSKVVLYKNGGTAYDYLNNITQAIPSNNVELNNGAASRTSWFAYAVHDPRQNLNSDDWKVLNTVETDDPKDVLAVSGTDPYHGFSNSASTAPDPTEHPSTGPDAETSAATEASLSTAHIRNAPMESPWELGFIHRGAKWETINLKEYDSTKAIQLVDISGKNYILGGGAYKKVSSTELGGDANILDQIKITQEAKSPQKISIDTQNENTLKALLSRIRYKCGIDDTVSVSSMAGGSPGTSLLESDIKDTIVPAIKNYYNTSSSEEILTRASAVSQLLLSATSTPVIPSTDITDAIQEEVIGKVVNLIKIGGKGGGGDFTVIVLAQSIKDIGTSSGVTIYKLSDDGTSGHKTCTLGTFDADTSSSDSHKHIYYDEITGEQKIMVKGNKSVDGKITITSFQYID